jgi:type I restriction enzyme S subunit
MEKWKEDVLLKDYIDVESGYAFKSDNFVSNGIPVIKIGNISDYKTKATNDDSFIKESDIDLYSDFVLHKGDIIIAMSGNTICKMGRVTENFSPSIINQRVGWIKAKPNQKDLSIDYVYYLLTSETYQKRLWNYATATGQPNLSPRDIKRISFSKPPLLEQTAIASIFSRVDEAIESVQRSIAAAERLKKSLMQNLLTGRMKTDGTFRKDDDFYMDEKLGLVPKGWEVKKFGKRIIVLYGKSQKDVVSKNGNIPVYGTGGIIEYATKSLCKHESVLVGRKGTIDKPYYINTPFWAVDTTYYVDKYINGNMKYLYYMLVMRNLKNLNEATGVPSITLRTLNRQKLIFPPLNEQNEIVAVILKMETEIQTKQQKIATLEHLKKSLMQNLLRGKVRVAVERIENIIKNKEESYV